MEVKKLGSSFERTVDEKGKVRLIPPVEEFKVEDSAGDDPNYPHRVPDVLYLRHASNLELDEEALHGAETACPLR